MSSDITNELIERKTEDLRRLLSEGWSITYAKHKAGISDKLHRELYDTSPEYKNTVVAYFIANRRGTQYFKETIKDPKKFKKYGLV